MSQVTRYHHGTVHCPAALMDRIDWAFGVSHGCCEDFGMYVAEAFELERLCVYPRMGRTLIPMAAEALSDARNVLDCWTLSDECTSKDDQATWNVGRTCDFCLWCQALVLRDWCDEVLDKAGFRTPPYSTPMLNADTAADYEAISEHVNALYNKDSTNA